MLTEKEKSILKKKAIKTLRGKKAFKKEIAARLSDAGNDLCDFHLELVKER